MKNSKPQTLTPAILDQIKYDPTTGIVVSDTINLCWTFSKHDQRNVVQLTVDGLQYRFDPGRLALMKLGIDVSGKVVHHINWDETDNRLSNLQVLTFAEHSKLHLRIARKVRVYEPDFWPVGSKKGRLQRIKSNSRFGTLYQRRVS